MSKPSQRGLVAVVLCTDPFLKLGKAQSRVVSTPDWPLIAIAHPPGRIAPEKV